MSFARKTTDFSAACGKISGVFTGVFLILGVAHCVAETVTQSAAEAAALIAAAAAGGAPQTAAAQSSLPPALPAGLPTPRPEASAAFVPDTFRPTVASAAAPGAAAAATRPAITAASPLPPASLTEAAATPGNRNAPEVQAQLAAAMLRDGGATGPVDVAPGPVPAQIEANIDSRRRLGEPDKLVGQRGIASWYGASWRGRRTASGERYDDRAMTAAHLTLPFATRALVTNLENGRSIEVVVNDRGPHHRGRIIDLSARAAEELGMKLDGVAEVVVTAAIEPSPEAPAGY